LKSQFLAIAAAATLVGSIRVVTADNVTPPIPPSEVCYDDLGNTRYVTAGAPCKPNEKRTKLIPGMTPDPADDPQAQLQKQVTDLIAKVSALQAKVDQAKKDQDKSEKDKDQDKPDKEQPEGPPDNAFYDAKTGKLIKSPIKRLEPDPGDPSLPDNQFHKMPGQKAATQKQQTNASGGAAMQRVKAPFEVVDSHGKVILRVSEDAETPKGAHVTIGASGGNKYGVRVFNESGQLVSGVGHGADGGGLVVVSDGVNPVASMSATDRAISVFRGSQAAVSMKANDNGGEMTVYNNGTPVGHMSVTGVGGGAIVVARKDGFGLFEAQAEGNGGGSACVNRISGDGTQTRACLGIGLPLR
jgi:hypothetical protein